jgi:hypothetical protein
VRRRYRVIQYGLGAMGAGMLKMMAERRDFEIVTVVSGSGRNLGMDAGEAAGLGRKLGVVVRSAADGVFESVNADIVMHATCSTVEDTLRDVTPVLAAGKNVITIAEELLFPTARNQPLFDKLDTLAKKGGVTILGTGINPGFMMDFLPLSMTGIMLNLQKITIRRVVNYGRYGQSVWQHIGVGRGIEEFERALSTGEVCLHVGLEQTVAITAAALGWELDDFTEEREPIITRIERRTEYGTVLPGQVGGFRQLATGWKSGEALIVQELIGLVNPDEAEDGMAPGNEYWLDGDPSVHLFVGGEFADQGGKGTIAHAVNAIPRVVAAPPGVVTVLDLPPAVCLP